MPLALFQPHNRSTHPTKATEPLLSAVRFHVHKFNNRQKPQDRRRTLVICCFSEFGCETIGAMYCIPRLTKKFPGQYIIVAGWHGRDYLYRHLVDEFWELDEEFMWLRNHTYAFHHSSHNLSRTEKALAAYGASVPSSMLGRYVTGNYCRTCGKYWTEWRQPTETCPACKSTVSITSVFGNVETYKKQAVRIPQPSDAFMTWAKEFLKPNTVGVFARSRTTYGRNLPAEYYIELIRRLESRGFNVIWMGEKHTTLPCPVEHVFDFSRSPYARDLERTFAIICNLKFTLQYWTASSRLAAMMGVPYVLIESPEQVYNTGLNPGQEGRRLELATFGPRKVILSNYLKVLHDQPRSLDVLDQGIDQLLAGDYSEMIGMVEDERAVALLRESYYSVKEACLNPPS
jgi:hypothetical protein